MSARTRDLSAAGYNALKADIDRRYPVGRFVAVDSGQVVADAESHRALVQKLQSLARSPRGLRIVEAGVDYPDAAVILPLDFRRGGHV
jgi:hypothetical protein